MVKRFLNVEYSGTSTRINVSDFEDLSEVQDAIKAKYGPVLADFGAPQLLLYDQQGRRITDLDDIIDDYYKKPKNGGLFLVIRTSPPPTREPSRNDRFAAGSTAFLPAEDDLPRKKTRTESEIRDLTNDLTEFARSQLVEGCIQSHDEGFLPYPPARIKKIYVRKCYEDVFDLLIQNIDDDATKKSFRFAIAGTAGIGKSLFFVYILYRLMEDFPKKTLSLKPNRVVYQSGSTYFCFDLQQRIVTQLSYFDAALAIRKKDTFYVIDGATCAALNSVCVVLFISSTYSEWYKDFVKQKWPTIWCFPVWTLEELQTCQRHCYPDLPIETLKDRHRVYGGVARPVFDRRPYDPEVILRSLILNDVDAVRGVKYVGETTDIIGKTHTLLHLLVGEDKFGNAYQFIDFDVASEYVGELLWRHHSAQMITNLKAMFYGSPKEFARHLFEIYGHTVFSAGGKTLTCRCLESGTVTEITLDALGGQRITFGKDTIPTAEELSGKYFKPTGDDNFPAIDSLSAQGMFKFTVAAEHPIRGVEVLRSLCNLYKEPKLYFVVPPHLFAAFKKQVFKARTGTDDVAEIRELKQYVLELPVI